MTRLPSAQFKTVVKNTVLVSLDLIITNGLGQVLAGERTNPPAVGTIFVPGGRIVKGETTEQALRRISFEETGIELNRDAAMLLGIYDHCYEDSVFPSANFNTQYVVIACGIRVPA